MARPVVQPWKPSESEEAAFRAGDDTLRWLCGLPQDAIRPYAGKWIAARQRRVIAAADSLDALLRELEGTDLQSVVIDRIERPGWVVYR